MLIIVIGEQSGYVEKISLNNVIWFDTVEETVGFDHDFIQSYAGMNGILIHLIIECML